MVGADTGVPSIGFAENAHDARVIVRERTRPGLGIIEPCLPAVIPDRIERSAHRA